MEHSERTDSEVASLPAADCPSTNPDNTDPGNTDPGNTDPGNTDPDNTDPGSTNPDVPDPNIPDSNGGELDGGAAAARLQDTFDQRWAHAGRQFGKALSHLARSKVDVELDRIDRQTYGEFVLAAEHPTCCQVIRVAPGEATFLLEIPPALLGLMLDRMLGAAERSASEARLPVTDVEQRLTAKIAERFLAAFGEAWCDAGQLHLSADRTETDPRRVQMARAASQVALVRYHVNLSGAGGMMHVCLPHDWLNLLEAQAAAASAAQRQPDSHVGSADALDEVELVATLAETTMTREELRRLAVGDIMTTDKDIGQPLTISINGTAAYRANLGRVDDQKAIQIVEQLDRRDTDDKSI